jgi:chromosome segregation ATPase
MTALFVALGIAVLTLLALLLWFVPHLLHQQALRSARENAQLREMLLDMLSEQEAVTLRQSQLSTSIAHLQDQLEEVVTSYKQPENSGKQTPTYTLIGPDQASLNQLEQRISGLQSQIQFFLDTRNRAARHSHEQDNESWAYLLSLLAAIQDRVGAIQIEQTNSMAGLHARTLLEELEQEMHNLRTISEDIATLQWRLRRSLHDRETSMSVLRTRASGGTS